MQIFPEIYTEGVPLGTQSQWGWHRFPNPERYAFEETLEVYNFRGWEEPYTVQFNLRFPYSTGAHSDDASSFLYIKPWTQFFDLQSEVTIPLSYSSNVTMRNFDLECNRFFDVTESDQYILSHFTFENLTIQATHYDINRDIIKPFKLNNVRVNGTLLENNQ